MEHTDGEAPDALGLVVTGSYAKGSATPESDLDLVLLTERPADRHYVSWFEPLGWGPLHVSLGIRTPDEWLERSDRPENWALGFPSRFAARYVWAAEDLRRRLGDDPTQHHPAGAPELEDTFEALRKVQRAIRTGDALAGRWHARDACALMPRLLLRLNPERVVDSRLDALRAALELSVAPPGWRDQLTVGLGLSEASSAAVAARTLELGRSLLAFLREHDPDVDPQPGISDALRDGTLEALLAR